MPTLQLTDEQVIDLFRQLPPERKRAAFMILAGDVEARRDERMAFAETQLRGIAAERGLDWDTLSEDERQDLVDGLVHWDRPYGR
jgi:hypothetical protein